MPLLRTYKRSGPIANTMKGYILNLITLVILLVVIAFTASAYGAGTESAGTFTNHCRQWVGNNTLGAAIAYAEMGYSPEILKSMWKDHAKKNNYSKEMTAAYLEVLDSLFSNEKKEEDVSKAMNKTVALCEVHMSTLKKESF